MSEMQRLIGRLEQFQEHAEKRFDDIDSRHEAIEQKLDSLSEFKWKVMGAAMIAMISLEGISQFLKVFLPFILPPSMRHE